MKFDIERSKVYDTIMYFNIFFNEDKISKRLVSKNLSVDECFLTYKSIKNIYNIDKDLSAFWAQYDNQENLLTRYVVLNYDIISNIEDLILQLNSKDFKNHFFDFHFGGIKKDIVQITKDDIYNLDIEANLKVSLTLIFLNYEKMIIKLCNDLKEVYAIVNDLINLNRDKLFKFRLNKNHYKVLEELSHDKIDDNDVYCISLLNSFICRFQFSGDKYYWILGYLCKKTIESNEEYRYNHISLKSVGSLLSNDLAIEILNIINDNKEINPLKIIQDNIHISPSSLYRVLNNLVLEKAIYISKKSKKNIYYSIDKKYFRTAANELSNIAIDDTRELNKYMNFINSILLPNEDYKKTIELLSNDYVLPILMIIKECKQVNSARIIEKISTKYNCSNSTVYRIITMLLESKVIYISKRSSNKIYYSINEPYFINAEQEMSNLLHYFIDKSDKK